MPGAAMFEKFCTDKTWAGKLNDPKYDLWMRFPFPTNDESRAETAG